MSPTQEQEEILALSRKGEPLKINAYAGTGKTSTLHLVAKDSPRKAYYLAFNKAIAVDAASRFPAHISCSTNHSLAYRAVAHQAGYDNSKMTGKANANMVADALKLPEWQTCRKDVVLSRQSFGGLILHALEAFMQSDDPEPRASHFPRFGKLAVLTDDEFRQFTTVAAKGVAHLWRKMLDRNDPQPLGHSGYVKLWALSKPRLDADYIMLDEAQDSNPVILGVLAKQDCPTIYVGDPYQQIYEWRGAVNAMQRVDTPHNAYLSQSFRFGDRIAGAATQVLCHLKAQKPLRGHAPIDSHVGEVHPLAILARTNAGVIRNLMQYQGQNVKCHVIGGTTELKKLLDSVRRLKQGLTSDLPDFFGFANWAEVEAFSRTAEGAHLYSFVKLVEFPGEEKLLQSIAKCQSSERDAQVCLSTAHRAKGKEWDYVKLDDDFDSSFTTLITPKGTHISIGDSEARLLYVAITRGKLGIEIPSTAKSFFKINDTTAVKMGAPLSQPPATPRSHTVVLPTSPSSGGISNFLKKIFG